MSTSELLITYFSNNEIKTKSIMDSSIADMLNKSNFKTTKVNMDIVKNNMIETVGSIMEIFENERLNNQNFSIDEIEVTLNIGCEGSVSILSTVSGQTNMQSGITLKLKRK